MQPSKLALIFTLSYLLFPRAKLALAQTEGHLGSTPQNTLIKAVITRPWPGENYPALPTLPSRLQENIVAEIATPAIRGAYEKLDAKRHNTDWEAGIAELAKQKAVWSLLSGLCHPSDDVQIWTLRSLAKLNDKRAVPFLLTYAEYMDVFESGSENATLHGIIQSEIAKTLSTLTGIKLTISGQDPEKLKQGIKAWRKWLLNHDVPDTSFNVTIK